MSAIAVLITLDNSNELKEFSKTYNPDVIAAFTAGYYYYYNSFDKTFKFFKNKNHRYFELLSTNEFINWFKCNKIN